MINIEEYLEELRVSRQRNKKFNLKKELNDLQKINEIIKNFEEISEIHDKKFLKKIYDQNIVLKLKLMNSKLKEKSEINERLNEMYYQLTMLNTNSFYNDDKNVMKIIKDFLSSKYFGISTMVNELNDLKKQIENTDNYYQKLMKFIPNTLCNNLSTFEHYNKHIKKLRLVHKKQKVLFLNIVSSFVKASKSNLKKLK